MRTPFQRLVDVLHPYRRRCRELFERFFIVPGKPRTYVRRCAAVFLAWLVLGGLVAPPVLRAVLQDRLTQALHTPCEVREVGFNPLTLALAIRGVQVPNPDGNGMFLTLDELELSPVSASFLRLAPGLAYARLVNPVIAITMREDGKFSFFDFLPDEDAPEQDNAKVFPFVLRNFRVENGAVIFHDERNNVTQRLTDIQLDVPFTSTVESDAARPVRPSLNATLNGNPLSVAGRLLPFGQEVRTEFDIATGDIDLEDFRVYLRQVTSLQLVRGLVGGTLSVVVAQPPNGNVEFGLAGKAHVRDMELAAPGGEKVASIKSGEVEVGRFSLKDRELTVTAATFDGLFLKAGRRADGSVDVVQYMTPPASAPRVPTEREQGVAPRAGDDGHTAKRPASDKGARAGADAGAGTGGNATVSHASGVAVRGNGTVGGGASGGVPPLAAERKQPFRVVVSNVALTSSELRWSDATLPGSPAIAVTDIDFAMPRLATEGQGSAQYRLAFGLRGVGTCRIEGEGTLTPARFRTRVDASGLPLAAFAPYLHGTPLADVQGTLGAEATIDVALGGQVQVVLQDGSIRLADVRAGGESASLRLAQLDVTGAGLDLGARTATIERVVLASPDIALVRQGAGNLTLAGEVAVTSPRETAAAPGTEAQAPRKRAATAGVKAKAAKGSKAGKAKGVTTEASRDAGAAPPQQQPATAPVRHNAAGVDAAAKPWNVRLKQLEVAGGGLSLVDNSLPVPARLGFAQVQVKAGPLVLGSRETISFDVSANWLESGQAAGRMLVRGTAMTDPLLVRADCTVDALSLKPLGPYVSAGSSLELGSGALGSALKIDVAQKGDVYRIRVDGGMHLDGLAVRPLGGRHDLLRMKRFVVRNVQFDSDGPALRVGDILLDQPRVGLVLERDGALNVQKALAAASDRDGGPGGSTAGASDARPGASVERAANRPRQAAGAAGGTAKAQGMGGSSGSAGGSVGSGAEAGAGATQGGTGADGGASPQGSEGTAPHAAASVLPFREASIGSIRLQQGEVGFRDERIKPPFSSRLTECDLSVTGLAADAGKLATLKVSGKLDGVPVAAHGDLNPLVSPPMADASFELTGFDLVPLSPYAVQYIAYPVEQGRLTAQVKVKTDGWAISADNRFTVADIGLGDKDARPGAPDYPVKLALALLQDLSGDVTLDIPVRGRLDDPDFRIGGVVAQAVMNMFVKAVTSPFALVGGLLRLGSGHDLKSIGFEPGSGALTAKGTDDVKALADMLRQRPRLKVEVRGVYDPGVDPEGYREQVLRQMVRKAKYDDLGWFARRSATLEGVVVAPGEYEEYLAAAYAAAPFEKPRNLIGLVREQPRDVMEKAIKDHVDAGPEEMMELATQRGKAVFDRLVEAAPDIADRMRLLPPVAGREDRTGQNHVELGLK